MSASQVHGMFGKTLMLAALTRIVEVCYFVPSYSDPVTAADTSEDVFPDGTPLSTTLSPRSGAEAWQHLPPFVSPFPLYLGLNITLRFFNHLQLLVASG